MFTYNPYYQAQAQVPYYDMNSFVDFFDELQRAKQRQLAEKSKPKIVKKVEAEDKYQIQIFKEYGDFNSYEVRAVRDAYIPGVINIVIESPRDSFKKVFQFELNSIELEQIDWEYFESDNVLVLNIPKKVKICCDSLEFGFPAFLNFDYPYYARQQKLRLREKQNEKHDERVRDAKIRKAEKARKAEARAARKAEELARKEAEQRAEQEAKEKARREAKERARKEAKERARQEYLEAQKKKELEVRAKREAYENAEKERYEEYRKQQQEFLNQVFGGFFRQFEPQYETPSKPAEEKKEDNVSRKPVVEKTKDSSTSETQETKKTANDDTELKDQEIQDQEMQDVEHSETESIESEEEDSISEPSSPVSPPSSGSGSDSDIKKDPLKLHKLPSLEEVEDEEFVMFRKKFGK